MDERLPKIDDVISTVFGEALGFSTGVKRRRTLQVEHDMRTFLETEADRFLTDDERTLLAAEREFEPNGAACRALEAEVLFVALTGFITPPTSPPTFSSAACSSTWSMLSSGTSPMRCCGTTTPAASGWISPGLSSVRGTSSSANVLTSRGPGK